MSASQQLLKEIRAFCRASGMAESTFGQKAVHDWKLAERLESGGSVTLKTAERIRKFISNTAADERRVA
jgi:hypothetical protein